MAADRPRHTAALQSAREGVGANCPAITKPLAQVAEAEDNTAAPAIAGG